MTLCTTDNANSTLPTDCFPGKKYFQIDKNNITTI